MKRTMRHFGGPRNERERAGVTIARTLGNDEARVLAATRAEDHSEPARKRRRVQQAQAYDRRLFALYVGRLRHGICESGIADTGWVEIPDELSDDRDDTKRILLDPGLVADWAYQTRLLPPTCRPAPRRSYAAIALEAQLAVVDDAVAVSTDLQDAKRRLAQAKRRGDPIEVAHHQARRETLSMWQQSEARRFRRAPTPDSIRMALQRKEHIFRLAEKRQGINAE